MTAKHQIWIGTSWKMNKTLAEAQRFSATLAAAPAYSGIQRFVIPSFVTAREVKTQLADTDVLVGAQNMHWADDGAWTGEVSPVMLKDCALDLVELGHSERRTHFGENDKTVGMKTEAAIRHGLIPLVCVGETAQDKKTGRATEVLRAQVEAALSELSTEQYTAPIVLAYEPVWAIGATGTPATPDYADEQQRQIIDAAKSVTGRTLPCLYGGSVNLDNCVEMITCPYINGLFIGRSAWQIDGYLSILSQCASAI